MKEVWVIDNAYVMEAGIGGQQLGQLPDYDLSGCEVTHFTQEEFDEMMEEFFEEEGYYPDT